MRKSSNIKKNNNKENKKISYLKNDIKPTNMQTKNNVLSN
jgi:hypothetical protein